MAPAVRLAADVEQALSDGGPVVALETAVVTAGLPKHPLEDPPTWLPDGWCDSEPVNLETARAQARSVRSSGATPALIAVIDGELRIGLHDDELERLARDPVAGKASTTDLAHVIESGESAGTTVSATLLACQRATPRPIQVFATGGIGGVHRHWTARPDISADLRALASSAVCTVCAGAKSMLDLPATLEALETLGVPILGFGTAQFPRFYSPGAASLPPIPRVDSAEAIARRCLRHWDGLGLTTSMLVTQPVPAPHAIDGDEIEMLIEQAEHAARNAGRSGSQRTPFVLSELARLTGGRSLYTNIALLLNNAELAARIAGELVMGSDPAGSSPAPIARLHR